MFAFDFAPRSWALCNGQIMSIAQNQALFSLLGTTYGGNGQTTFALPDLRSCVPIHMGAGFTQGERGGEERHTLIANELPMHNHYFQVGATPTTGSPASALLSAPSTSKLYRSGSAHTTALASASLDTSGSNLPHDNVQPYLVVNFAMAITTGIFPSRN